MTARRTDMRRNVLVHLMCGIGLALPATALAQSATGSIEGVVVDQSGAVLPGVTINITQAATGVTRSSS